MDRKEFGKIITQIRYENRMTVNDFAKKYKVSYQAASRWERGLKIIPPKTLKKICEDYNLDFYKIVHANELKEEKRKNIIFITISVLILLIIIYITSKFPK